MKPSMASPAAGAASVCAAAVASITWATLSSNAFMSVIGFWKKSAAPSFIAATASSTVP